MKNFIFPVAVAGLLLTSCSSAYKTGQTPDDVYYSTGPVVAAEVREQSTSKNDYQSYWANPDDDYLRMKVRNGGRWNNIDDLDYWYGYSGVCQCNSSWSMYNSYSYGYNNLYSPWGMNSLNFGYGYNPWGWNSLSYGGFYSGYYPSYYYPVIISKYPTAYSNPSRPSLRGYGNTLYGSPASSNRRMSSGTVPGSGYRSIFGGNSSSGGSNSGSYDRPARTFESSGGSSSGGSSRSSGGGSSSGGSSSGGSSRGGRGG